MNNQQNNKELFKRVKDDLWTLQMEGIIDHEERSIIVKKINKVEDKCQESTNSELIDKFDKILELHIIKLNDFMDDYWHNERTDYRAMLEQIIIDLVKSKKELEKLKQENKSKIFPSNQELCECGHIALTHKIFGDGSCMNRFCPCKLFVAQEVKESGNN